MTLFTEAQKEEVKRRMSVGQKRRRRLMSEESREGAPLEQRLAKRKHRKKTPEQRIAMSKATAVFHFRVTNLDTDQIVLEGLSRSQIVQSDFGKEYTETT